MIDCGLGFMIFMR